MFGDICCWPFDNTDILSSGLDQNLESFALRACNDAYDRPSDWTTHHMPASSTFLLYINLRVIYVVYRLAL
jgi:hypothetical protein